MTRLLKIPSIILKVSANILLKLGNAFASWQFWAFLNAFCFSMLTYGFFLKYKGKPFFIDNVIRYDPHVDFESALPLPCQLEEWKNKSTTSFPFYDLYHKLAQKRMTGLQGLSDSQLRLLTAFLYEDYIVVTHTAQIRKDVGRVAFCHYFDCNRKEIPESKFQSFVFPMVAVHCPRRVGAVFMSLTFGENDIPQEPIPLLNRIFKEPPHELGVCAGPIYGTERKWLEIVEYIEHHKLMGASMLYFTILEMDGYTKRTIEDYQRLGQIEATFANTEYEGVIWLFHMIQVHECFFRSKFHSKWVIFNDIDERLVMTKVPLISYLRQLPPSTCEINFGNRRVAKYDSYPEKYVSDQNIIDSLPSNRYNLTTSHHWVAFKFVFQPAKVHAIYFHWTWRQHEGCQVRSVPKHVGYIRHYRDTSSKHLRGAWIDNFKPYSVSKRDTEFSEKLQSRVLERVKYIYNMHPVYCESIDPWIRGKFKNDLHCVDKIAVST